MCVGIPMRILERSGDFARCESEAGLERVDLSLVPQAGVGDHVLVFLGAARRVLDGREARLIADALAALSAVITGSGPAALLDAAFADLDREPQLPPHLAAALAAGRKEA
ncbi:HypC/HybG/HupF family hydrogenase formation chaperone [Roseixanthobacter glucoisosaccharinicivorans]|uniref:HypC/HybG/HupF family hydrogenase formation chaperone n=1 Tax=Roseixanthobacter glucoisosaccharinicivorans TaxID=3119923 RepID=UPI0037299460